MATIQAAASSIRVPDRLVAAGAVHSEPGRQGFMKQNMELDFVNRSQRAFSATVRNFGAVRVARVRGGASTFKRASRHRADGRDLVSIVISGGGRFCLEGKDEDRHYSGCGAAVLESREESVLHCLEDSDAWTLVMDRAPLDPLLAGIRAPLQRCIQGDNAAMCLLDGYLKVLFSVESYDDRTLVSRHIRDLALSALGLCGDAQAYVREGGVREARLQTVLDRLARDAAEPGLDPAAFAARLDLSPRYLHRLLEPTGRSFNEHLLKCRLERASAMLRDPHCSEMKIAEVAAKAGFSDISHFNRSFRRAYGDTPIGVRVRAARARSA
ncbi:MAG: AraC family transcriptional regulator [Alphaproteobacteria bacterium]|nr:AraC family transcriptional regulator [Alphaproteobacteria bacterium]